MTRFSVLMDLKNSTFYLNSRPLIESSMGNNNYKYLIYIIYVQANEGMERL